MTTGHRTAILKAVHSAGGTATLDEMTDAGMTRKQLHDNVTAAVRDGLLLRIKDVTGVPAYKMTAKGAERMSTNSTPPRSTSETSQPAVEKNTGRRASETSSEAPLHLPSEGAPVAEAGRQSKAAAAPASDETLKSDLESILSTNRKFCEIVFELIGKTAYPLNLYECSKLLKEHIDSLAAENTRLKAENTALKTLNDAMPGFGAAFEQNKATRYGYATDFNDNLFDTPEAAADAAMENEARHDLPNVTILACHPIAKIAVKPVLVPLEAV